MAIFALIGNLFKVAFFFMNLWTEKDKKKAEEKKKMAVRVANAFKQTDKKKRASRLNAVVGAIGRMRK